ncbi:MAG: LPS export ABC transporter periplasmic protein LptC [Xanthomonadaceae bacterium]|nr:LPS export ABC transporter periplasmic protein LptC [Xanthomonadaceae bacterium]MDE1963878.1 LPS export ABC transporter periplasmic protein LptC [Xanthomonadaceae bacterium]
MKPAAWFGERRLPTAIVVVGLLAGATGLLRWWMTPEQPGSSFVGPPRSGYTLTDFQLSSYGRDGRPAFNVAAPRLERREGDEALYINAPAFDLPSNQAGVPDWRGESLYGWVGKGGDLIKLQGPVHMHRQAYDDTAAASLDTEDLTIWPKDNRMETAAAARMAQGALTMSGVGMRANLNDKHLELLDDVHATFPPRKR